MMQKEHDSISNQKHDYHIILMAENIRTPENTGMIMRLADAFGLEKIYFVGDKAVELTTKVKRASRNTYKTIKYAYLDEGITTLEELKAKGYDLIALEITDKSKPLQSFQMKSTKKVVLLIGSERHGISEELLKKCDSHYHIPMFGDNSSINVVNALSIGLFKITESAGNTK